MSPLRRRVLLGAGLAGFAVPGGRARAAATSTPAQRDSAGVLPLGALFPFSGPLSLLGDESFRGLDLAADERNARGGLLGRPIALRHGDAGGEVAGAAEARRLLAEQHVAAIFGTFSSSVCLAGSAIAEAAEVPYFELDALGDAIMERGFRLLFRSGVPGAACGALAVDTAADLLAPRWGVAPTRLRLVLLHHDAPAGTSIAAAAQARAAARGLRRVENIVYAAGTLDFAPIVRRLRGTGAEVVLHSGMQTDVLLFHRAMQQAGWRPRMVIGGGGGYALADTAQVLGAAFEGVMSIGPPPYRVSEVAAPGAAGLAAAYQRKYGAPPRSGHSLVCFAGARAFFDAIARAGTLKRQRLRTAVLATDIPDGASIGGSGVRFDARGQNQRARPFLSQWQKGELVTIAPFAGAVAAAMDTLGG